MRRIALALAFLIASVASAATKPVVIFVEGDPSIVPSFINDCRQMGARQGLDFRFVDKKEDPFDYRVVLSGEGPSGWSLAQGNIVVLSPDAKVLFSVVRTKRWTAKGATNAITKEFVKALARYLSEHH